ncbi:N-acetylglucosamine-6-phosphate deacetylase [Streptomyces sp. AD681]|uniref:N-acetylglucosamine-6-phosphate deacetylase n=1 Tax=Streptomyces sp. AD681 TaxID=3019069 RepID=UPI0022F1C45C|nr:N-acetylglucosamine-6-phosphate deacetylase [Streptomyces sp. AD681]MDA5147524.1 N-acetylglucosamine-6-phosphate deacetylase [Streptomyces sp. AD681]
MTLFTGARLILHGRLADGWLRTEGDRVAALGAGEAPCADRASVPPGDREVVDLHGAVLAPGFVDVHCHGAGGAALYSGDPADVRTAAAAHLVHGTTTMLGSVATMEPEAMLAAADAVADAARDPLVPNLVGVHLEGPFLAPGRRGAQTASALRRPDAGILHALLDVTQGLPTVMTIAPELDGAIDLIERYSDRCVFAVGHTDATYEQVLAAAAAGARHVTHLFNAMPALGHRAPGPVAAALTDRRLTYELIADGTHVAGPALAIAAGQDAGARAVLVTDAMAAAGLGDGDYAFADRRVEVRDGIARLAGTDRIAGSTAFLADCVRHLVTAVGVPVPEAVAMASAHPAGLLGPDGERGVLAVGARADLVVLGEDLTAQAVYVGGRFVGGQDRWRS